MQHKYLMTIQWQNIALHFYTPFDASLWVLRWIIDRECSSRCTSRWHFSWFIVGDGVCYSNSTLLRSVSGTLDGKIKLHRNWPDAFHTHLTCNFDSRCGCSVHLPCDIESNHFKPQYSRLAVKIIPRCDAYSCIAKAVREYSIVEIKTPLIIQMQMHARYETKYVIHWIELIFVLFRLDFYE